MKTTYTKLQAMYLIRKYNKNDKLVKVTDIDLVLNYLNTQRFSLLSVEDYINDLLKDNNTVINNTVYAYGL